MVSIATTIIAIRLSLIFVNHYDCYDYVVIPLATCATATGTVVRLFLVKATIGYLSTTIANLIVIAT